MNIEIINTGSELLLGRVLNSHQQWLCRRLSDLCYQVTRQVCVADEGKAIEAAVRESLSRVDVVITTGGLGPTSDDITCELIARMFGRELVLDDAVLANIEAYFKSRNRPLLASVRRQALVPKGSIVLRNRNGTAPGLAIELPRNPFSSSGQRAWVIMLPGPPRELYPMFLDQVVPLLQKELPPSTAFACRTIRTAGMGESLVEETIAGPLQELVRKGLEIGYCARTGEVDLRFIARGDHSQEVVAQAEGIVGPLLGNVVFGFDNDSMESVIVRLLTKRKKTLAIAESCTGGLISNRITNVPGASEVLISGLVTYSNEAKKKLLGVTQESLEAQGAVSEAVAREMAEGARKRLGTDFGISVTGIAGPGGGSEAKPVGTVFMAVATEKSTVVKRDFNPYDRETFKFVTSQQILNMLRKAILAT